MFRLGIAGFVGFVNLDGGMMEETSQVDFFTWNSFQGICMPKILGRIL